VRSHQALKLLSGPASRWRLAIVGTLLIAALACVGLISFVLASQEPDYSLAVQNAVCQQETADGTIIAAKDAVELPYAIPSGEKGLPGALSCAFTLNLTETEIRNSALLIPFFVDSLTLKVNGQHVMNADMYTMRLLRFASVPAFPLLPEDVLRVGDNRFLVEVYSRPARTAALDRIFFGGEYELRPYYHARWFVAVALPTLAVGCKVALAVMFALIWSARPKESAFGWLSSWRSVRCAVQC